MDLNSELFNTFDLTYDIPFFTSTSLLGQHFGSQVNDTNITGCSIDDTRNNRFNTNSTIGKYNGNMFDDINLKIKYFGIDVTEILKPFIYGEICYEENSSTNTKSYVGSLHISITKLKPHSRVKKTTPTSNLLFGNDEQYEAIRNINDYLYNVNEYIMEKLPVKERAYIEMIKQLMYENVPEMDNKLDILTITMNQGDVVYSVKYNTYDYFIQPDGKLISSNSSKNKVRELFTLKTVSIDIDHIKRDNHDPIKQDLCLLYKSNNDSYNIKQFNDNESVLKHQSSSSSSKVSSPSPSKNNGHITTTNDNLRPPMDPSLIQSNVRMILYSMVREITPTTFLEVIHDTIEKLYIAYGLPVPLNFKDYEPYMGQKLIRDDRIPNIYDNRILLYQKIDKVEELVKQMVDKIDRYNFIQLMNTFTDDIFKLYNIKKGVYYKPYESSLKVSQHSSPTLHSDDHLKEFEAAVDLLNKYNDEYQSLANEYNKYQETNTSKYLNTITNLMIKIDSIEFPFLPSNPIYNTIKKQRKLLINKLHDLCSMRKPAHTR